MVASRPSNWLIGTWRSDKELTVAGWKGYPPASPAFQKILLRELGKLTFEYTAQRVTSLYEGVSVAASYRVVWESGESTFIVSGTKSNESGQLINFVTPSRYWVHVGRYVEYFTKLEQPNSAFNGRRAKRARPERKREA